MINKIEEHLYLGNEDGGQSWADLNSNNIKHVISILDDFSNFVEHPGIVYKRICIGDNAGSCITQVFSESFPIISAAQKAKENILVHCAAGVSRSPSVLIGYFMVKYSISFEEARNVVDSGRPGIWPNAKFRNDLKSFNIEEFRQFLVDF
jgi:atypical dual specificity phosphatase